MYAAVRVRDGWLAGIDFTDVATAKARMAEEFDDWDPRFKALITEADGPLVPRRIHALPVGHRWARVPGVTLLGDAAHVMSPFAGEGANLAMQDGAELAAALLAHPGDVETALGAFETAMFPRAEAAAAASASSTRSSGISGAGRATATGPTAAPRPTPMPRRIMSTPRTVRCSEGGRRARRRRPR